MRVAAFTRDEGVVFSTQLDLLSLVGEGSVTRLRETNNSSRSVHCFLREVIRTCGQAVSFITLYHGSNG